MRPLVIELFCGRFGWSKGFVAEGYRSVGFDIVHEDYHGPVPEHCELVLQDVLTLHGSQFRDACAIIASPPCQAYSYMAMPWKLGKAKAAAIRTDVSGVMMANLTALFDACFRIQREANEANCCAPNGDCMDCDGTGNWYRHDEDGDFLPCDTCGGAGTRRYIPMVVENVRGAQPWVGRAAWNYGSFYLWGDVPALMPITMRGGKNNGGSWFAIGSPGQKVVGQNPDGRKVPGMNFHDYEKTGKPGRSFQSAAVDHTKVPGLDWSGYGKPGYKAQGFNVTAAQRFRADRDDFGWSKDSPLRNDNSKSDSRKAASAAIAEIPLDLAQHIARCFKPSDLRNHSERPSHCAVP